LGAFFKECAVPQPSSTEERFPPETAPQHGGAAPAVDHDPYAAIRPFRDDEVRPVIDRLLHSQDFLLAMARLRLGDGARHFAWLLRPLLRAYLARQLRGVSSVLDFQLRIRRYVERMIDDSTAGFSVSGLEALDPGRAYLFVSNHRDIAMDPAFTNYALHRAGHDTLRIAIGDNLLTQPWVADLMRLNKSFIVRRSVSGPRELLAASRQLAGYIRHSIEVDNVPVWIAQREGRAKDGVDRTEPAVIKMLALSRDKGRESFAAHIAGLRIVPVSISYELDPCDAIKAAELWQRDTTGHYEKAEQEDVASIGRGIAGSKGHVHVHFGAPLAADHDSAEGVAAAIDAQVIHAYRLHPTNIFAYRWLYDDADLSLLEVAAGSCSEAGFRARVEALPEEHRRYALAGYANPVLGKLALPEGERPAS
jgi:hypothetical protein